MILAAEAAAPAGRTDVRRSACDLGHVQKLAARWQLYVPYWRLFGPIGRITYFSFSFVFGQFSAKVGPKNLTNGPGLKNAT